MGPSFLTDSKTLWRHLQGSGRPREVKEVEKQHMERRCFLECDKKSGKTVFVYVCVASWGVGRKKGF